LAAEPGAKLRDVFLFDLELVGTAEPGNADTAESGVDTISGNGGEDILFGQGNGAVVDAYGTETGVAGAANCQTATGGPGSGSLSGTEEAPNGDDDNDDLPDLNDPQCRATAPGDTVLGESGEDYIEGNQGSDNVFGADGEDDVIGGSSSNTGQIVAILPPNARPAGFAPGAILDANRPFNLNDGHDVVQGNGEDDVVVGDNAFADRYTGADGVWLTLAGPGGGPYPERDRPNAEPARGAWTPSDLVRRDVTTRTTREAAGAFGNDYVQGGTGKDDVYGLLGNDWLEGNEDEDAIVGDMGKIVNNQLGGPTPDTMPDPALDQFIEPSQPFLGSTINDTGSLKREVTLYAFDESQSATAGIGHDVALGGDANDAIHTGPGEDLANGNVGDDRIWLGDNFTATVAAKGKAQDLLAHDRVEAAWGGSGHDILYGGYGADYLDVRPRNTTSTPGLPPTSDPETWFQIAGKEPSHNGVLYNQENFEGIDFIYGGWDQDAMMANHGDNGPIPGDRLMDWAGVYNANYVCPSTNGAWITIRSASPGMVEFLQAMSQGGGSTTTATAGTSGFRETAIVFQNEHGKNANPTHPDTPGHFTCGPGTTIP
ncbi:MAG TPA: calcium-binding protein, partial [Gaiellaceae bacterium]|nr:calcium-binding protein [Gaiellaceae bacterium]